MLRTLTFVAAILAASTAVASEPAEVEALIEQANNFRREGKDGKALPLMRKAYDLATTARTAAQLGLVEVALGYWLQAEQHLVEALSSPRDPWIHQNRAELERVLAGVRSSIGEVEIAGEPTGAQVFLNGQFVGSLPLSKAVRVGDGPVRLEVRAPGYKTSTQTLTMSKGSRQRVDVLLAREAMGLAQPAPPSSAIAERPPAVGERLDVTGRGARPATVTAAWITAGGATLSLAVGVAGSLSWMGRRDAFDSHTVPVLDNSGMATNRRRKDCGVQNDNRGGDECADLYDQMNRAKTFAVIGYVSGGLLAAGAAALFLITPSAETRGDQVAFQCVPTLATVGGACRLAF